MLCCFCFEQKTRKSDEKCERMNAPSSRQEDEGRGNGMRDQGGRTGGVRKKDTVCKFWVQGRCLKGDKCEYLHEYIEDKVPICSEFLHHGVCKKANCKFRHKLPPPCDWYQRGFCKHGKHKCSGTHTPRKACMAYLLGFCPNGPECPDAQFATHNLILFHTLFSQLSPFSIFISETVPSGRSRRCTVFSHRSSNNRQALASHPHPLCPTAGRLCHRACRSAPESQLRQGCTVPLVLPLHSRTEPFHSNFRTMHTQALCDVALFFCVLFCSFHIFFCISPFSSPFRANERMRCCFSGTRRRSPRCHSLGAGRGACCGASGSGRCGR